MRIGAGKGKVEERGAVAVAFIHIAALLSS